MNFKLIALSLVCAVHTGLFAQALPQVEVRFAHPVYEQNSRTYALDVEMKTIETAESLFGINVRFFFDASLLEFKSLGDFHPGYGIVGDAPRSFVGNEFSGTQVFDLSRAAGYVNGAVQLTDDRYPLALSPHKWVKAFRVHFTVPKNISHEETFCPSLIWDQKTYGQRGGFLGGSDGVVITVMENKRDTRQETAPTMTFGSPFNWEYEGEQAKPYGRTVTLTCLSLSELVSTNDPGAVDSEGYALFQNQPNPFDVRTTIEFILPYAQDASLIFFDADGKTLEEVKGHYEAGRNQVALKLKPWMGQSNVFYYRLQTEKYTSSARVLNVIRA